MYIRLYKESNECNEVYLVNSSDSCIVKFKIAVHKLLKMQNSGKERLAGWKKEGGRNKGWKEFGKFESLDWKLATWKPHIISFILMYLAMIFDWMNMQIQFRPQLPKLSFWFCIELLRARARFLLLFLFLSMQPLHAHLLCHVMCAEIESNDSETLNNGILACK